MATLIPEADVTEITKSAMRCLENIAENVDLASAPELMHRHDTLGGLTFIRMLRPTLQVITRLNHAIDVFARDFQQCKPVCEAFWRAITTEGWKILEDMAFGDAYQRWMDLPMPQDLFNEHGFQAVCRGIKEQAGQNTALHIFLINYWRWFMTTQGV